MNIVLTALTGSAVMDVLEDLARLRINIFREYPYLYEGDMSYEVSYLDVYSKAPGGIVILAKDGDEVIGAGTGVPLRYESPEFCAPFRGSPYPLEQVYYLGEILFLPPYRGRGFGSRILSLIEDHARQLGAYRFLTCASVVRPASHPLRPAGFLPIDHFCRRHGFSSRDGLETRLSWPDLEGVVSGNRMTFWVKGL